MRTFRRLPAALVVVAVLAVTGTSLVARSTPGVYAQQAPRVEVAPTGAAPGEPVTLRGSGWPAGATLSARLYEASNVGGPGAWLGGTIQVGDDGTFSAQGTVPLTLFGEGSRGNLIVVPGEYAIVVRQDTRLSVSVPFTVGAPRQGALLWGEVALDVNGNGRRDAGDRSTMALLVVTGPAQDSPPRQAISDGRGRYVLTPLEPGPYQLRVQAQSQSATWAATAAATATEGRVVRTDLLLRPPDAAAPAPRDARYFAETAFWIDHDPFWDYFNAMGGVDTFGFPISRTFTFLGCTAQFFQRQLLQQCGSGPVQTMNLLDPDLMPYNQINFSTFPAHDPAVARQAPPPGTPNYGIAVLGHVRRVAPEEFAGLPVRFFSTFVNTVPGVDPAADPDPSAGSGPAPSAGSGPAPSAGSGQALAVLVNLQIWGFPTSQPALDPTNHGFVYQRFQRGTMHFDAATGVTRGILLADWFKSILTGQSLPPDLAAQAQGSRFLHQYCPANPQWLCRPDALPATDLTFAFERH